MTAGDAVQGMGLAKLALSIVAAALLFATEAATCTTVDLLHPDPRQAAREQHRAAIQENADAVRESTFAFAGRVTYRRAGSRNLTIAIERVADLRGRAPKRLRLVYEWRDSGCGAYLSSRYPMQGDAPLGARLLVLGRHYKTPFVGPKITRIVRAEGPIAADLKARLGLVSSGASGRAKHSSVQR
jgi:hypothetical protein